MKTKNVSEKVWVIAVCGVQSYISLLSKEPSLLLLLKLHIFEVAAFIILAATEATSHHLPWFWLPILRVNNYLQIGCALEMLNDLLNELLMSALHSYPEYRIARMVSLIDV